MFRCARITVIKPRPRFIGSLPDGTPPAWYNYQANVGCMLSFPVIGMDTAPECE